MPTAAIIHGASGGAIVIHGGSALSGHFMATPRQLDLRAFHRLTIRALGRKTRLTVECPQFPSVPGQAPSQIAPWEMREMRDGVESKGQETWHRDRRQAP